ncbi:hypothetical protein CW743_05925 [Staphylococcus shinii]|nr:hypothetical protein CW743_05925 [Staphylococcus shinii]
MSINFVHTSKGETDRVNGNKKLNQNYMKKVEDLKQHVNNYSLGKNTSCSYEFIGIEELNMLSQLQKSYSGDLKVSQNPIYVSFGDEKTKQKRYIATFSLKNFFKFLVDYDENDNPILKEYLFESNIRDYQNSTEVNKAINILKEIIYNEKDKDSNVNLTNFSKSEKLNALINQKLADYFINKQENIVFQTTIMLQCN